MPPPRQLGQPAGELGIGEESVGAAGANQRGSPLENTQMDLKVKFKKIIIITNTHAL